MERPGCLAPMHSPRTANISHFTIWNKLRCPHFPRLPEVVADQEGATTRPSSYNILSVSPLVTLLRIETNRALGSRGIPPNFYFSQSSTTESTATQALSCIPGTDSTFDLIKAHQSTPHFHQCTTPRVTAALRPGPPR